MPPLPEPPEALDWDSAIERISRETGVVLLMGATDVGKSTLALQAANAAATAGRPVAVVDTDVGQSEVGPPGTVGVVRLDGPVASLTELKPRALAFVGDTSPVGHLLPLLQGSRRLVDHARSRGDELVVVDTSGMVEGRLGEKLKLAEATILQPSLVMVVARGGELTRLESLVRGSCAAPVIRVRSAPDVRKKSPVYRRTQRANRMNRHFEGARLIDLDASQVMSFDTWLYSGTALTAWELRAATEALKTPVLHGESTPDGIFLCTEGRPDRKGFDLLQEDFKRRRTLVTPAIAFRHLLIGLIGDEGRLVDIGLLQGINFERAIYSVLTPARSVDEVRQIHFGRLRLRRDGSEIARLRPSDM